MLFIDRKLKELIVQSPHDGVFKDKQTPETWGGGEAGANTSFLSNADEDNRSEIT